MLKWLVYPLLSLAAYTGIPLYLYHRLNADISLPLILVLAILRLILLTATSLHDTTGLRVKSGFFSHLPKRIHGKLFNSINGILGLVLALITLSGIIITPYSAYKIWFQGVTDGRQYGVVSNLIVLLATFLVTSVNFYSSGIVLSLSILFTVTSGIFTLIYQSRNAVLLFILATLLLIYVNIVLFTGGTTFKKAARRMLQTTLSLVPVFALSYILSLSYTPSGSAIVDTRLHPALRRAVLTLFPRFPLLYGLPGYGTAFKVSKLGGTPVLSSAPLFKLNLLSSEKKPVVPLYLRTGVYDYYDGIGWKNTKEEKGKESKGKLKGIRVIEITSEEMTRADFQFEIEIEPQYYFYLPHTINTYLIALKTGKRRIAVTGSLASGFTFKEPLEGGDKLFLAERSVAPSNPGALGYVSPGKNYLELPPGLPDRLKKLAHSLCGKDNTRDNLTPARIREISGSIQKYLASNYSYSLKVPPFKKGVKSSDFVSDFLFDLKRGYCVHFATSFVILARLCGIPSRYVTGFLAYPSRMTTTTISGLQAHSWPEIWIPGKGWMTWEATPAVDPGNYEEEDDSLTYNYDLSDDRLTERQLFAILGKRILQSVKAPAGKKRAMALSRNTLRYLSVVLPLTLLLLLGIALLLRFFIVRLLIFLIPLSGVRRLSFMKERLIRYMVKKLLLPEKGSLTSVAGSGWVSWIKKRGSAMRFGNRELRRVSSITLKFLYGREQARWRDLLYLAALYRKYMKGQRAV